MKKTILLLISTLLLSYSPVGINMNEVNKKNTQDNEIKCRLVCDKKLSKEQKIIDAISFYKNSKDYKFTKKDF